MWLIGHARNIKGEVDGSEGSKEERNSHGLTMKEKIRVHLIMDRICQRYGITKEELDDQDGETKILIIEEIHWEMIQDILQHS